MKFALTDEQRELRDVLRGFLDDCESLTLARLVMEEGGQPWLPSWESLGRELGIHAVDAPEDVGGTGLTFVELVLVVEEMGAGLYPGPYLASSGVASGVLQMLRLHASEVDRARVVELMRMVAAGEVVTLAAPGGTEDSVTANQDGEMWRLTGAAGDVLNAQSAQVVLVNTVAGAVFEVASADLAVESSEMIDSTRPRSEVTFHESPARLLGILDEASRDDLHYRTMTLIAADSLGGARACLERTRDYAASRVQFGKPIGSFQAVKHRLADLLVEVELATSAVFLAACHVASEDPERSISAPMAWVTATDTYTRATKDATQLHGGIAFTWEYDMHLFTRRAASNRSLEGARGGLLEDYYRHQGTTSSK